MNAIKFSLSLSLCLYGTASYAVSTITCPPGSQEHEGQCWSPNPSHPNPPTTPTEIINGAIGVGTGIGIGTGIGHGGQGGQGGAGGQGGNATGGRGGNATGGNATGGNASAGVTGSGNSSSRSGASANNSINIDNRTRQSAAQASPVIMGGYGPVNCFGDTNPSGQFGASMQVFGWGVTANSSKASNVCAAYAIGGPAVAMGYLQKMDPNMPRSIVVTQPTGRVSCPATHPVLVEGKGCRK